MVPIAYYKARARPHPHPAGRLTACACLFALIGSAIAYFALIAPPQGRALLPRGNPRCLRFHVCNGFTNQRLALVYGFTLAAVTKRAVFLPVLISDGTQASDGAQVVANGNNALHFSAMYDVEHLRAVLASLGVHVFDAPEVETNFTYLERPSDALHSAERAVDVGCTMLNLEAGFIKQHEATVWTVLEALRVPSARVNALMSDKRPGAILHLRSESDWQDHCATWSKSNRYNNHCLLFRRQAGRCSDAFLVLASAQVQYQLLL